MKKTKEKSDSYFESDAQVANQTRRPILSPGIGRRIGEVAELLGTRESAYSVMGVSSAALQRYIKDENMPSFDAIARLCLAAGASMEWLATGEGSMRVSTLETAPDSHSQPVKQETLKIALELAIEALGDKVLPPAKHAELVSLIYELLEEGLPEAKVLRFARVAG